MNTPFSLDQFLEVFKNYNETVFPAQLILYLSSLFSIYLLIKQTSNSNKVISAMLSFLWLWMGIVYHIIFFAPINSAAYVFGMAFILQSILFLNYGVFKNLLSFSFHSDLYGWTGIALIGFALFVYPVLGFFLGHVYPSSPTFGLPCPTTIFTFGVLLIIDKKIPVTLMIIPFFWSLIGFTAAVNLGIWEDLGLLIAGLLAFTLLLIKNRKYQQA